MSRSLFKDLITSLDDKIRPILAIDSELSGESDVIAGVASQKIRIYKVALNALGGPAAGDLQLRDGATVLFKKTLAISEAFATFMDFEGSPMVMTASAPLVLSKTTLLGDVGLTVIYDQF